MLWFYWQLRDYLPPARGWIRELVARSAELDDHARAELLVISAVTAAEVGEDDAARTALRAIEAMGTLAHDPSLESDARLAASWVLPLDGDMEGADPRSPGSVGWVPGTRRTVPGLGVVHRGAPADDARPPRRGAPGAHRGGGPGQAVRQRMARVGRSLPDRELGRARGHLDEARTLLAASVHLDRGAEPSIQGITFALVALARLARAEGEPEAAVTALGGAAALRQRSGSATWPSMRRDEAELAASLEADLGAERYQRAFARGRMRHAGSSRAVRGATTQAMGESDRSGSRSVRSAHPAGRMSRSIHPVGKHGRSGRKRVELIRPMGRRSRPTCSGRRPVAQGGVSARGRTP